MARFTKNTGDVLGNLGKLPVEKVYTAQEQAARKMLAALAKVDRLHKVMTEHGVFDDVAVFVHPDFINETCDAVLAAIAQAEKAGITTDD